MLPTLRLPIGIGAGLLTLGFLGSGGAGAQEAPPPDHRAVLVAEGREIYRTACAPCHGARGDGTGPVASWMTPRPRDFTAGVFKFRSTASGALPADGDLYRTISRGVPGTWMPAWDRLLGERQRWAVVQYLKTLVPAFQAAGAEEPPLQIPDRISPDATAREGRSVYLALKCGDCHGLTGRGDGPSAGTLKDDQRRPIRPYDLIRGHYKNGARAADLYRTLRTGLDGTPMPAYAVDVVLFPGDRDVDLTSYAKLAPDELERLKEYLASQPGRSRLAALSAQEREDLADRRLWSLVAYLRSLPRGRGLLYRLFAADPNVTPSRQEGAP